MSTNRKKLIPAIRSEEVLSRPGADLWRAMAADAREKKPCLTGQTPQEGQGQGQVICRRSP
jgi:hypothetical protein